MKIPDDVVDVLKRATITGTRLELPEQLDRATYMKVDKVLKALGFKWNKSAKAHICAGDGIPNDLTDALRAGTVVTAQEEGFFPTPQRVAQMLFDGPWRAGTFSIRDEIERIPHRIYRVLEPSCGTGDLLIALDKHLNASNPCPFPPYVVGIEKNPKRIAVAAAFPDWRNFRPNFCEGDFLEARSADAAHGEYDLILMNPPFGGGQDVQHVLHAMKFLRRGGLLLGIGSAGLMFREDRKDHQRLRELINYHGDSVALPEGSFKPATAVNTCRFYIRGA